MAKNYFYLRPSADISVEHTLEPTDSPNAYSLINEEEYDSSTYIKLAGVAGETVTATSSFKMSGTKPPDARYITDASLWVKYNTTSRATRQITVTINGQSFVLNNLESLDFAYSSQPFVEEMKKYNELDEVTFTITSTITTASDAKLIYNEEIYHVFIEIVYGNGILRKINDEWKPSYGVYQKINGIWTELENGYDVVSSSLSRKGHHQVCLPAVAKTCSENGLTEGYKCSICGEMLASQNVIPASHDDFVPSGGFTICETCGYIDGLGYTELVYNGTTTELSVARRNLASTTIGNYALFGGGDSYESASDLYFSTVDAYNQSLTRTLPAELSVARSNLASTTIGNYALFGGGYSYETASDSYIDLCFSTVDAYNQSLTRTLPAELSAARRDLASTTIGNYALFGGGYSEESSSGDMVYHSTVDAYNQSLTKSNPAALSTEPAYIKATSVGSYAIFVSGKASTRYVDVYDTSLTKITTGLPSLRVSVGSSATSVGKYAIILEDDLTLSVCDKFLTKISGVEDLSVARSDLASTTIGNYALFGGGCSYESGSSYFSTVDAYNQSLTRTLPAELSVARRNLASTTIGNYALFGGGDSYESYSVYHSTVDVYKLQPISQ